MDRGDEKTNTVYDLWLRDERTGRRYFSKTYQGKSVRDGAARLRKKYERLGYVVEVESREVVDEQLSKQRA